MGITSELFPIERDENPTCQFATIPNTVSATNASSDVQTLSPIEKFK
jgi:hypothetical protein